MFITRRLVHLSSVVSLLSWINTEDYGEFYCFQFSRIIGTSNVFSIIFRDAEFSGLVLKKKIFIQFVFSFEVNWASREKEGIAASRV